MTDHHPTPWRAESYHVLDANDRPVANLWHSMAPHEGAELAPLLAAAPELLQAAEDLYAFLLTTNMDADHPRMKAMAAAIAKAKQS